MSYDDFKDFLRAMSGGSSPGKEISRRKLTPIEREKETQMEEEKNAIYRECRKFEKEIKKRMAVVHNKFWDLIAQKHGYATNDAAIADGMAFQLRGEDPEDDEEDEREIVVFDQRHAERQKEEQAQSVVKKARFEMPN